MNSNSSTDCPLCGAPADPFDLDGIRLWRCRGCGFLRKDPRHHPTLAAERERYDRHAVVAEAPFIARQQEFLETFALPYAHVRTALDFGSGRTGVVLGLLAAKGFQTTAYDPFYAPDPTTLERRYGLVVATEVVEHFRDPAASWGLLTRLALPDGVIAVSTRFVPADFAGWWYRRDTTHLCFYTPAAFRAIAARFGLAILAADGDGQAAFQRR